MIEGIASFSGGFKKGITGQSLPKKKKKKPRKKSKKKKDSKDYGEEWY